MTAEPIDVDCVAEVKAAIRAHLAGTPTLPHHQRRQEIAVALTAAWERQDGAAIVQLGQDEQALHVADLGLLTSLSAELLRALGHLTGQRPAMLLETMLDP